MNYNYVCFTPNLAYLPYTGHCVRSLLSKIKRPDLVQLVLLTHQEVKEEDLKDLFDIVGLYGAPKPLVYYPELELDLDFRLEGGNNVLSSRSQTPFYRLFLPTLLTQADKCLYLDVDVAILSDLSPLLETDPGDCYVAGVTDRLCLVPSSREHVTKMHIKPAHYLNGGVLVMNLKALRRDGLPEIMDVMGRVRAYPYMDQDIINYVCMGNVKLLEKKYNVFPGDTSQDLKFLASLVPGDEYLFDDDALVNPSIVHYIGPNKPWNNRSMQYADLYYNQHEKGGEK